MLRTSPHSWIWDFNTIPYRIISYHIICIWYIYISISWLFCDINMLISYHISYDISHFMIWCRPLLWGPYGRISISQSQLTEILFISTSICTSSAGVSRGELGIRYFIVRSYLCQLRELRIHITSAGRSTGPGSKLLRRSDWNPSRSWANLWALFLAWCS